MLLNLGFVSRNLVKSRLITILLNLQFLIFLLRNLVKSVYTILLNLGFVSKNLVKSVLVTILPNLGFLSRNLVKSDYTMLLNLGFVSTNLVKAVMSLFYKCQSTSAKRRYIDIND